MATLRVDRLAAAAVALLACNRSVPIEASSHWGPTRDVMLSVASSRFDYEEIDTSRDLLVVAHMGSGEALAVGLDGRLKKVLGNLSTPRGVAVAPTSGRFYVTVRSDEVVEYDADKLEERRRFPTSAAPDGVAVDEEKHLVAVSAQGAGSLDLIDTKATTGRRTVALGKETGNVRFDASRSLFWVTVVGDSESRLASVTETGQKGDEIALPGCEGAHGLRLFDDGHAALVACEDNAALLRVDLAAKKVVATVEVGASPDVLAIDPSLGLALVAAESGDVAVVDVSGGALRKIETVRVDGSAHTVAIDPSTHKAYFPLEDGGAGAPVLRVVTLR